MVDLSVNLAGISMKNPVTTGSGTYGYGQEYQDLVPISALGALVVKGVSMGPRRGNPIPRIAETPSGMLNAIGLQNPGVEVFKEKILPEILPQGSPIIVNIFGNTVEEYVQVAQALQGTGVAALEVNISCPNVKAGGLAFGTDPQQAAMVVREVRQVCQQPLIAKLSPNVTDVVAIARAVEEAGADAVSLINTLLGMAIDVERRRPVLANRVGGLSGPAIRPIAVRMVWQVAKAVQIPIIGMGGIMEARDALEFILAGASAVAVGTAHFRNPRAALDVIAGIEEYCQRQGVGSVRELIGGLKEV